MSRNSHEEALAAQVLDHLAGQTLGESSERWDLFSEVTVHGRVCDIVGRLPSGVTLAVECKMQLGWRVVQQAAQWRDSANYVVVATPAAQRPRDESLAREILTALSLGWTTVGAVSGLITEALPAPPLRTEPGELGVHCREEHRWWAKAGNARGERFTLARKAAADFEAYVRTHPRCTLEEAIAAGATHYRSAKAVQRDLVKMARRGRLGALRVHHDGVRFRWTVDDETQEAQSA